MGLSGVICDHRIRFISEATLEDVSDDLDSSLDKPQQARVRIDDGTKGQKQAPIGPKQKGERSAQRASH